MKAFFKSRLQALHVGLVWLLLTISLSAVEPPEFRLYGDFAQERIWTKKLLERAYARFAHHFSHALIDQPKRISVFLRRDPTSRGVAGSAAYDRNALHLTSNLWQNDRFRRWIAVHELSNLLAARYGSQGYPSDWWSNGRSPFPIYAAWLILGDLGYAQDAHWLKQSYQAQQDHALFWHLHERYGPQLFQEFFRLLRLDKVQLDQIGKTWPHPDAQRAQQTACYLSRAAGENLAATLTRFGIGKRPHDWHLRHKRIVFIPYTIDAPKIDACLNSLHASPP
ncbi:MAG: hypothetical protein JXK05_01350 [Campylobacterales bacterium]|nr:hypothetical protein [Campylobacterales bacterium]